MEHFFLSEAHHHDGWVTVIGEQPSVSSIIFRADDVRMMAEQNPTNSAPQLFLLVCGREATFVFPDVDARTGFVDNIIGCS